MKANPKRRNGSTIVESCLVMILLCLILFGILQLSITTAAHDIVAYAASAGARCASIGYDDFMVDKTIRIAALPNMGPKTIGLAEEKRRVREYIRQQNNGPLSYINSEYWNSLRGTKASVGEVVKVDLSQNYPLVFPFARAFRDTDYVTLSAEDVQMENHSDLYLVY